MAGADQAAESRIAAAWMRHVDLLLSEEPEDLAAVICDSAMAIAARTPDRDPRDLLRALADADDAWTPDALVLMRERYQTRQDRDPPLTAQDLPLRGQRW